jgi:hypothetical protein
VAARSFLIDFGCTPEPQWPAGLIISPHCPQQIGMAERMIRMLKGGETDLN